MPTLAALLIPLIPGLVQSLLAIVDTIRGHVDTPDAAKQQLADISTKLDELVEKVKAIQV